MLSPEGLLDVTLLWEGKTCYPSGFPETRPVALLPVEVSPDCRSPPRPVQGGEQPPPFVASPRSCSWQAGGPAES